MVDFSGAGLGLRNEFIHELAKRENKACDFLEVAPENWLKVGGKRKKEFAFFNERYPIVAHGLSLSLGGPAPLDKTFLRDLKRFFDEHDIACYSEHLSYSGDSKGLLYDLLPIPFTDEAVAHVASRIKTTQEILERRIAVENISYYAAPGQELQEADFVNAILKEADCDLLLDVNNIYVNSVNHHYDAKAFIDKLDLSHVAYIHMAGHKKEREDLIIDTHGRPVIDDVWELLDYVYEHHGVVPTLIERDNNIPPLLELEKEVGIIKHLQGKRANT